jgi:hypothetical protein
MSKEFDEKAAAAKQQLETMFADTENRLVHPKHAKGVDVNEEEILLLQKAAKWFLDVRVNLVTSTNLDQVVANCPPNN